MAMILVENIQTELTTAEWVETVVLTIRHQKLPQCEDERIQANTSHKLS